MKNDLLVFLALGQLAEQWGVDVNEALGDDVVTKLETLVAQIPAADETTNVASMELLAELLRKQAVLVLGGGAE
ncbi:hypothetical protein [Paenibacillus sp. P22]|uniref:hypothetical protein n=1 Tax=Paenibacillus sp. P22 TaxID=483908 RepID=UPI00038F3AFC|nr:hypothetical protein [Paenibacillus sp. P22]CDN42042.1 hypothetical protein BN871_AT_00440 [Paenibacillus sp. P22]